MAEKELVVWGVGTLRTFRVYWALHEIGLAFSRQVIRTRTADMDQTSFMNVSPGKKIPALQHGDLTLTESGAIVAYLYDRFGQLPATPAARGEVARWSFFVLTEMDATALYVLRRHRDLPEIYGEAPAAVASAAEYFERQAKVVDRALQDGRTFVAGSSFSQADIHLVSCCDWALFYDLPLPTALAEYHAVQRARPSYAKALESNDPGT